MPDKKSQFATRFEKTHAKGTLPEIYRRFILDGAYVEHKTSFIQNLMNRGPTYTEVKWDDQRMLSLEEMYDERDIKLEEVPFRPIATIRNTHEFLAIDPSDEECPVYIWTHDDGNFHRQFDSFDELLGELRTKAEVGEERARVRRQWSNIKKQCKPALTRARKHFEQGDLDKTQAEIDLGLKGWLPIEYTGQDTDYKAIELLSELYNLQGLVALKRERYADAVQGFVNSCECRLCTPAWVNAMVACSFTGDVSAAYAIGLSSRALHNIKSGAGSGRLRIDSTPSVANFTAEQRDMANQVLREHNGSEDEMKFAKQVMRWLDVD